MCDFVVGLQRFVSAGWVAMFVLCTGATAQAKPWKGAEVITHQTFRYGAFEARIRAARGGGVITPFFLWKDGSEQPGAQWQEQDFELFGRDGTYQTQLMTPGKNGTNRTEHVVNHTLPTKAWERYYTYRMEWTPTKLSFSVDGNVVRTETNAEEYQKLMDPAQAEAAQLRFGIWAGDFDWSGAFDPSAVPAAVFVNWMRTYAYTPGAGPNGSDFTELWRDDFDSDSGRFWRANWTFEYAVNDYVPQNAALRSGYMVVVLTNEASTGQFPVPPVDDGVVTPPEPEADIVAVPGRVQAEAYVDFSDKTVGNVGDSSCSATDVDAQLTTDTGGGCNIGWTAAGEWLDYDIEVSTPTTFDLSLRVATNTAGRRLHVEIDGVNVSGSLTVPVAGWQSFRDVVVPGVPLLEGVHSVRLVFETIEVNVNYIDFIAKSEPEEPPPACSPSARTYEAELMSATTGGPAPSGWNLWSNGSLSTAHTFLQGDSIVRVQAYGQSAAGVAPHMVVRVGTQVIGDVSVSASAYRPYDFFYSAAAGAQPVTISFDNDFYQNGEDRNLYLDAVSIEECLAN